MTSQWVVSEQTHRAHITAGRHAGRNIVGSTDDATCRDVIHIRYSSCLKRCQSIQQRLRFVSNAVGYYECKFHGSM